jgi:hypothetical protein
MSTKYYLHKVPVESVGPGFSLAIHHDGNYRLFQVESPRCPSGRANA